MRESIARRKVAGTYRNRAPEVPADVEKRIVHHRSRGRSYREIALMLDLSGEPPPRAAVWPRSTVRKVLARERTSNVNGSGA